MGTGTADPAELWLWAVVLLPLVVCGLMASLKVGELAAMLVSGSGNAGSGFVALVMQRSRERVAVPATATRLKPQGESANENETRMQAASTPRSGARPFRRTGSFRTILIYAGRQLRPRCPGPAADRGRGAAPAHRRSGSTRSAVPRRSPTRAATAQADPLRSHDQVLPSPVRGNDFHSRRRATVEEQWTRSLRFLSTDLANAAFAEGRRGRGRHGGRDGGDGSPGRERRAPHPPRRPSRRTARPPTSISCT